MRSSVKPFPLHSAHFLLSGNRKTTLCFPEKTNRTAAFQLVYLNKPGALFETINRRNCIQNRGSGKLLVSGYIFWWDERSKRESFIIKLIISEGPRCRLLSASSVFANYSTSYIWCSCRNIASLPKHISSFRLCTFQIPQLDLWTSHSEFWL